MIETVAMVAIGLGLILLVAGSIWFLVEAFSASIWWGLGCLLISPVSLIFLIAHFDRAARPTGLSILGTAIVFAAAQFIPESTLR